MAFSSQSWTLLQGHQPPNLGSGIPLHSQSGYRKETALLWMTRELFVRQKIFLRRDEERLVIVANDVAAAGVATHGGMPLGAMACSATNGLYTGCGCPVLPTTGWLGLPTGGWLGG